MKPAISSSVPVGPIPNIGGSFGPNSQGVPVLSIDNWTHNPQFAYQHQTPETIPHSGRPPIVRPMALPQTVQQHPVRYFDKLSQFGSQQALAVNPNRNPRR